jgi:hypothetical protein
MDAVEILECSGHEPPGVEGSAWSERSMREVGKPSPAPSLWMFAREAMGAYKPFGEVASGRQGGGEPVVPIAARGQHNLG